MLRKICIHGIVYSFFLLTISAQENKLLDNLESEVEIITGKEPTGKMLMPFHHRPYAYPLIVQPVNPLPIYRASANLVGDNAESGPNGIIIFRQWSSSDPVMVTINATGFTVGKHAVHIHAYGDLKEGCKSTGPHVRNILIGNVEVKEGGKLEITFHSPYLTLFGPKGIVGRSIVIHEKPIEFNRFPDIYGIPITPTVNGAPFQAEEQSVGAVLACGIITITDNSHP
ncbi:superoxide dismutase [Cu-Zn] [Bradysia coprophila]|uniref:superoxide dismutase [Cu-Zn] n=1 Tax=Bradysia coprophila TaxID=38358 RepID=UPI00187DAA6A|nr:superoxide dismutase [Cu-Zn] [Bradysia coprophila]XP_037040945.1 superoxide dismutase [Cu-Zn] [Bradysia coprophila]